MCSAEIKNTKYTCIANTDLNQIFCILYFKYISSPDYVDLSTNSYVFSEKFFGRYVS